MLISCVGRARRPVILKSGGELTRRRRSGLAYLIVLPFILSTSSPLLTSVVAYPIPLTRRNFSSGEVGGETKKKMEAPVAEKRRHEMKMFGDVRVDDYYWLRDDTRSNPDVLSYLRQENNYTDSQMAGTKKFEDQIYAEIRGRIKEDDVSAPVRKGSYYYYERTLEGQEYVQHCRRLIPNDGAPASVYDTMPTGNDAPHEHVILDENVKAKQHAYYSIGTFKASPNNEMIAYAEDTKGDEIYTVYVINADTGAFIGKPIVGVTSYLEWAGDKALVYITMDEILRPDKAFLHKLESDQSEDLCLYHEKDDMFSLDLEASESKRFLFVGSESKNTRSIFYLDTTKEIDELKVLTPRLYGIDTSVSHRGNHFFIKRRSDEFFNSELLVCPLDDTAATTVLLPHRKSVKIQDIQLFAGHLVVYERENSLQNVSIYKLPAEGQPITSLQQLRTVDFIDPIYSVDPSESQFSSSILRFSYSSMKTPPSVYDYDMNTGTSVLKKMEMVLGGFDSSNYVTERKWASASDGTQVPLSIVYRKNLVKLDGSDPLLLYGYGSYEICIDPSFKASRLSLLDRGFIFVIAHIRGGGEMGRQWYENGKLLKKRNTFSDFITCAEYLIENKYCSKEKLCINGRSAGGLLMGAVLNMRPDLFKAAVAGVPFVDVVTTMLDPTIPLTTSEWEEWGDPRKEEFYFYMKSYSPVDNVRAAEISNFRKTIKMFAQQALVSPPSTPRTGCTAVPPSSPRTGCTAAAATSRPTKRILSRTVSMRGGAQTVVENTKKKGGNLYQVLRLDKGASPAQIKAAYRSLVKQFHPDTNKSGSVDSSGDFIEIHNAYATLSDPIAKARYDLSISLSLSIGIGFRCGNDDDCFVGARQTQTRRWETDQCW